MLIQPGPLLHMEGQLPAWLGRGESWLIQRGGGPACLVPEGGWAWTQLAKAEGGRDLGAQQRFPARDPWPPRGEACDLLKS